MREFRDYLHIRRAEGVFFKAAAADLESVFAETYPTLERLVLSNSIVSRTHRGEETVHDPVFRENIVNAIEAYFAKIGCEGELDQVIASRMSDPNVHRKIENLRRNQKRILEKTPRTQRTTTVSGDNNSALFGVWNQVNFTHIDLHKIQVRIGLKLIYPVDGHTDVISLGRSVYWKGRSYMSQRYFHVTETAADRHGAECANYVFDCFDLVTTVINTSDDIKPVCGLIQVVSHQKHRHMFAGRCVLIKDQKLSRTYGHDYSRFIAERHKLQTEHVRIVDLTAIDDISFGRYSLIKLIDVYLAEAGEQKIDIPHKFF